MDKFYLLAECLHVVEVAIYCIKSIDASSTCSHNDGLASHKQLHTFGRTLCLKISAVVLSTKSDAHHALGSSGDGVCIDNAECALNGRHNLCAAEATNLALYLFNLALHLDNFFSGLGLRHTYNVNTSLNNGLDVLLTIRSI